MNTLIVYAHQEPKSMNGALLRLATEVLSTQGEVVVSDLYRMRFNAVAGDDDFVGRSNPDFWKYQTEQVKAYAEGRLAQDIRDEQEKIAACDLLILQFPLWWFSVPAIMKGWFDRVLTPGFSYGGGRLFEQGPLRGKKAMLSLTTGGMREVFDEGGRYGNLMHMLHHINFGILAFCGFEVIQPFVVHAPARIPNEERERYLQSFKYRLEHLDEQPLLHGYERV